MTKKRQDRVTNCHLVKIVDASMRNGPTIKLPSGRGVCRKTQRHLFPSGEAGVGRPRMDMYSKQWTGWMDNPHLNLCWSYWLAPVPKAPSFPNVYAWPVASMHRHVQTQYL